MKTKDELPECPVATTVSLIGGKWKLLILRNLKARPWRFNELHRDLDGISQKVLTDSPRQMIDDGLAYRHDYLELPLNVDKGWFMFFVTLLNQIYWVVSSTVGSLLGYVIHFNTKGIEFVMTAMFVVMFLGQWDKKENRVPALVGLIETAVCLPIFGSKYFIVPAMVLIVAAFAVGKR